MIDEAKDGMSELVAAQRAVSNCCNGRVGRAILAALKENPHLRELVIPQGVNVLTAGAKASHGGAANCCNGRVGRSRDELTLS